MNRRYRKMMEQVSLGEGAKARLLERMTAGERKRHRAPIRTALAAACVCLGLVGGALAAEAIFGVPVFRLTDTSPVTGEPLTGFANGLDERGGQAVKRPEEAFSLRVLADVSNGTERLEFASWEDAEEYLGVELMDNAALAQARWDGEEGGGSVTVSLSAMDGVFAAARATAVYRMNETAADEGNTAPVRVGVTACVYTEHSPIAAEDLFVQYGFHGDYTVTAEEYIGANGLAAVIAAAENGEDGVTTYVAQFLWNGAAFTVDAVFAPDDAHTLDTLKQVLDAFA